jgi:hypothetical protein
MSNSTRERDILDALMGSWLFLTTVTYIVSVKRPLKEDGKEVRSGKRGGNTLRLALLLFVVGMYSANVLFTVYNEVFQEVIRKY